MTLGKTIKKSQAKKLCTNYNLKKNYFTQYGIFYLFTTEY